MTTLPVKAGATKVGRTVHTLKSSRSTDEIEAREDHTLIFRAWREDTELQIGDLAVITSADGDVFLGEVEDADDFYATIRLS